MCGIAGEIAFNGRSASREPVLRMMGTMTSRGPDGRGTWDDAGWIALGHQRLSIIDLSSAGAQPMLDDGGLAITFNGCIYNYRELRSELEREFSFRTTSDTEVILKAYRKWGDHFVHHLVGMFAVALYDPQRQEVLLVRDRLGIKPLYVASLPGKLRFASTLPALVASGVDTGIDEVALHHYLSWHSIVPAPRTILRGVRKLPAATIRTVRADGTWQDREYWRPGYTRRPEHSGWSPRDWQDAIRDALGTAVRRRMVADVPVGVLLSGGLDSSLLVALLAEEGQHGLSTFSIGFDSAGGDTGNEFAYSDLVAREFGTRHERFHVSTSEFAPSIDAAVGAMSEPMASHDVTAFHLLSKTVAEQLKVVQCGQGADEVFAGYGYHQPLAAVGRQDAFSAFSKSFVDHRHGELVEILEPEWFCGSDVSGKVLAANLDAPGAETALDAVLRLDTHLLMVDDPVKRLDNMSMAWGIEARVPFLDHELVELAAACPPGLKASQGGKGILKDLGRQLLPAAIIDRPKGYFPVPALRHLEEPFISMMRDALHAPEAKQRGLFRPTYLDGLLADPNIQRTPVNSNVLWQFALLEMWLQHHKVG